MWFIPITRFEPSEFFSPTTLGDLQDCRCPECRTNRADGRYFCLVGRHKEIDRKVYKDDYARRVEETTYSFQGCYIGVCEGCFRRLKKVARIARSLKYGGPILGILIFALFERSLAKYLSEGWLILLGLIALLGPAFLGAVIEMRSASSLSVSRKAVKVSKDFPSHGVPYKRYEEGREFVSDRELPKGALEILQGLREQKLNPRRETPQGTRKID